MVEEPGDRSGLERCRRLVEDQEPGADRQSARNLHDLPLLDRQVGREEVDVEIETPLEHQAAGLSAHTTPRDEASA